MGGMAERVPGVDAWELWNEPDGSEFFAGGPQPARYAAMVKSAYRAIKAVQPGDTVVTGGMVGNDMDFLAALYSHGAQGHFDAVGVHTDTACLTNGPDAYYRDERGRIGRYTFSAYREVHAVMSAHGDGAKPIWMTELGWNTQSTRPRSCNTGTWAGKKRIGVSERRQARFLRAAYRCLAADPFVGVALWFGFQDIRGSAHARGYGLFRSSGRAKPSAQGVQAARAVGSGRGGTAAGPSTGRRRRCVSSSPLPAGASRGSCRYGSVRSTTRAARGWGGSTWPTTGATSAAGAARAARSPRGGGRPTGGPAGTRSPSGSGTGRSTRPRCPSRL